MTDRIVKMTGRVERVERGGSPTVREGAADLREGDGALTAPSLTVGLPPSSGYPSAQFCDKVHPFTMSQSNKLNLKEHVTSKDKKQRYVNRLFETIAGRYDFFTVFMSYGMDRGWKREMIR